VTAAADHLNCHFPLSLAESDLSHFMTSDWLPAGFFDAEDPLYPALALSTFFNWAQSPNRFRHAPTQTWRGGPSGVRWVAAVICKITTCLTLIDQGNLVPEEVQRVFEASSHRRMWRLLGTLTTWFNESVQDSIATLAASYPQRSQAWKAAVINSYLTGQAAPVADEIHFPQSSTNGVPRDLEVLHTYFVTLTQTDPDMTLGDAPAMSKEPPQRIKKGRARFATEPDANEDDDSYNGEGIHIPDFSSSSDGSDHVSPTFLPDELSGRPFTRESPH
jgi:hypothetical protein